MIPLILKLKKTNHKEIARSQDLIVEVLYSLFENAVLHGGTSIWRCYNGNRFSEDVDVYLPRDIKKINSFFEKLERAGFIIKKRKIGKNSLFSILQLNKAVVRFEAVFKKVGGSLKEYENAESNYITIYTLTPEELIEEKVNAYLKRLKIRDFYDVFFLLRYVKDKAKVKGALKKLIGNFKMPIDEKNLKAVVIEGLVPKAEDMLNYISREI